MKKLGHEVFTIFTDYKNSFLTKRSLVLAVMLFLVTHIFLMPVKEFAIQVQHKVSIWTTVFLLYDFYYLLIFLFACIYFFSNTPFLNAYQLYRIIRTGKVKWGVYQMINILLSSILLIGILFFMTGSLLFPHVTWNNDWGKVVYTLSLTNRGEAYDMILNFPYDIIKSASPFQIVSFTCTIGVLSLCFLGNLMFTISLYVSRLAALTLASAEAVLVIMVQNMYLFPNLIYFAPFSWIQLDILQQLHEKGMPTPDNVDILFYLILGNLICILLTLKKLKNIDLK